MEPTDMEDWLSSFLFSLLAGSNENKDTEDWRGMDHAGLPRVDDWEIGVYYVDGN